MVKGVGWVVRVWGLGSKGWAVCAARDPHCSNRV
jgi:hypothetical protein